MHWVNALPASGATQSRESGGFDVRSGNQQGELTLQIDTDMPMDTGLYSNADTDLPSEDSPSNILGSKTPSPSSNSGRKINEMSTKIGLSM